MKPRTIVAVASVLTLAMSAILSAQLTATQTVTFQVDPINELSVSGAPSVLLINLAVPGSAPTSVTTAAGPTWSVTTNQTAAKITASIPVAMAAGLTLSANMVAPGGGSTSAGLKALGTVAVDMVTGITKLNQAAMGLTYQLDATSAAGVVVSSTRVVTYTVTGGT
jgi:hypothetical protein